MRRTEFLKQALRLNNVDYLYGGRMLDSVRAGVDCWGLVAVAAMRAKGPKEWMSWFTDVAFAQLEPCFVVEPGALAFYGGDPANPKDVAHVAVHLGAGLVLTTTRGDHRCTTLELSRERAARVTAYTTEEYEKLRQDFRGLRKLSFDKEN